MTTFDQREQAFEQKFAHDEELRFKVHARRNHMLGLWAAKRLQMKRKAAEQYAEALTEADVAKFRDDQIVERIARDFATMGVAMENAEIRRQMDQLLIVAKRELGAGR
jgi:hypothetical protein